MVIKINKTYRIYGKMEGMKKFSPCSKNGFCINLIYADLFTINDTSDLVKFEAELLFRNSQGTFEARAV